MLKISNDHHLAAETHARVEVYVIRIPQCTSFIARHTRSLMAINVLTVSRFVGVAIKDCIVRMALSHIH